MEVFVYSMGIILASALFYYAGKKDGYAKGWEDGYEYGVHQRKEFK
jgi:hypothetical protein